LWAWQVSKCLDHGQLPLWFPDLNAGFGSPGIRLYSPLGPLLTGSLGLLLGDVGRGLRAAAIMAMCGILAVSLLREPRWSLRWRVAVGVVVIVSPAALFSLFARTAWSEYLAIPCAWWVLDRMVTGRLRGVGDGIAVAVLWLLHAPTAVMVGVIGGVCLLLQRSWAAVQANAIVAAVAAGLTCWHWLPLVVESGLIDRRAAFTTGLFTPARNLLGSETAFGWRDNLWLGWAAIGLLAAVLAAGAWTNHRGRVVVAIGCVALASPLAAPLWRLETPLIWLQFPWRWLLPATLILVPAIADPRGRRAAGLFCLLAPSLLLTWVSWVQLPVVRAADDWHSVGTTVYDFLGANPLLVDVPENRPPAFDHLAVNLESLGLDGLVSVSNGGDVVAVHRWAPLLRSVEVSGSTPATVSFRVLDYPGWSVSRSGGEDLPPGNVSGLVSCRVPEGRHVVDLEWVGNPWSSVGQIVAALTVLVLVVGRRLRAGAVS
jgi:hypothetical protein